MTSSKRLAHELDEVGALFHHVGPGNGQNLRLLGHAQGHGDAVGLGQPAGFVGDEVGDFGRMQTAVNLPGEGLQLHPDLLLAYHLPQLVVARVARGQAGHAHEKLQELPHGVGAAHRVLPDLHHAGDLLVVDDGGQQDEQVGRIARPLVAGTAVGGMDARGPFHGWPGESIRRASAGWSRSDPGRPGPC